MGEQIPRGRSRPLWWTLRAPARPLTYHAVHRMFERVTERAGASATLHSLRHTAAYRMAEDPDLPLTDVQFVLGHAQLTTTQIYLTQGSGIASAEREIAGRQVSVAGKRRLRLLYDSCLTRSNPKLIPSDASYAH